MIGVSFGDKHLYEEYKLVLEKKEIGPAVPNICLIDIPFGKKQDITEALYDDVTYSHREIKLILGIKKPVKEWQSFLTLFYNLYNGQRVTMIFDDDNEYYYVGRAEFSDPERECKIGKLTMNLTCEPYKYRTNKTVITKTLSSGENRINLRNRRMRTRVMVECTNDINITIDGKNAAYEAGTFSIIEPLLKYGDNEWIVTGTGNVTFTYQEGDL